MKILKIRKFSNHPDDHYLSFKLVHRPEDKLTPYVTYLHNNYSDCLCEGHYFKKLLDAEIDFEKRR